VQQVQPQLSRIATETKGSQNLLTGESEELNRALVLTLARAMEITGDFIIVYLQNSPFHCQGAFVEILQHGILKGYNLNVKLCQLGS
jgi:hypothetical protein